MTTAELHEILDNPQRKLTAEEQIEEMAFFIFENSPLTNLSSEDLAKDLYNAGYRKQSEGEWIKTETNYTCSACNFNVISWSGEYDGYECERGISLMKFCPNCGAKMKGDKE